MPSTNYKSSDESTGITKTVIFYLELLDGTSGTCTAVFKNGILTSLTRT